MPRITGAYEAKTKVEIILPYTIEGEPAFDDGGRPVKGAEPVVISLQKFNYMNNDDIKELVALGKDIDGRELTDDYNMFDRKRDSMLASLRLFVEDDVYKIVDKLTVGELADINKLWATDEPVGESSASASSSTGSTRRR